MADDEVTKLVKNLNDLNKVSFSAGLEFKGLTKRLIKMSDTVSGGGRKWTIFSRIVSGSPIWKIQNKVRAFIDSLALMQEASEKNAKAQKEANERVINLVQSNEKMKKGVKKLLVTQKEMLALEQKLSLAQENLDANKKIIPNLKKKGKILKDIKKIQERVNDDVGEAVKNSLAYNKAILLGEKPVNAYIKGLKEIKIKAEQTQNVFKKAKKDAIYEDAFTGDTKTFKQRMEGISKAFEGLKKERKEAFGIGSKAEGVKKFLFGTEGSAKEKEQGDIFQRIGKFIDPFTKIQRFSLKYQKFMFSLGKMTKPIMSYLFKTLIFLMMGILAFLILAKVLHNAYGFLVEMGVIEQMKEIGSLLMSAISPILGIIGALFEGDLDRLIEKGIELGGILLDIGILTLKVILKTLFALGVSVFYTAIDFIERLLLGEFNEKIRTVGFKIAKFLVIALAAKMVIVGLMQIAAIYALPLLILGIAFLIMAAFLKKLKNMLPDIPFFADGGVSDGGMAVVGEKGPELVSLPKGSRVHSNSDSKKMVGSSSSVVNNFNITVNAKDLSDAELRRVAKQLGNDIFKNINRTSTGRGFV